MSLPYPSGSETTLDFFSIEFALDGESKLFSAKDCATKQGIEAGLAVCSLKAISGSLERQNGVPSLLPFEIM